MAAPRKPYNLIEQVVQDCAGRIARAAAARPPAAASRSNLHLPQGFFATDALELDAEDDGLNPELAQMMREWLADEYTRRALGRGSNPARNTNNNNAPPSRGNTVTPSSHHQIPPAPASPFLTASMPASDQAHQENADRIPLFFKEAHAGFIVKGNFMTLAAKPAMISEAEWMAHQVAEQNRLLGGMIKCMEGENRSTGRGVCNAQNCPTMSAGVTTYTWIDTSRNPINLPAPTYIKHIQTWVNGKIQDQSIFPSDSFTSAPMQPTASQIQGDSNYWFGKSDGFPQRYESEVRNMFKQMFRCYAHLYWSHWMDFWHLNCYRDLNTCFVHFINVGRIFGLFTDKDIEPMKQLIDLWTNQGVLPEITSNTEPTNPNLALGTGGSGNPATYSSAAPGASVTS